MLLVELLKAVVVLLPAVAVLFGAHNDAEAVVVLPVFVALLFGVTVCVELPPADCIGDS